MCDAAAGPKLVQLSKSGGQEEAMNASRFGDGGTMFDQLEKF